MLIFTVNITNEKHCLRKFKDQSRSDLKNYKRKLDFRALYLYNHEQQVLARGTFTDNELQRLVQPVTTSGTEWYNE